MLRAFASGASRSDDFFHADEPIDSDFAEDLCSGDFSLLKQKRRCIDGVGVSLVTKHWDITSRRSESVSRQEWVGIWPILEGRQQIIRMALMLNLPGVLVGSRATFWLQDKGTRPNCGGPRP